MVTASLVPRRRVVEESPERWQRALARAEGLTLYQCSVSGCWYCTSGSEPGIAHPVTFTDCGCAAAVAGDRVCRHRAALRCRFGLLAAPESADTRTVTARADEGDVIVLTAERCRRCRGTGSEYGGPDVEIRCLGCDGDGWVSTATTEAIAAD